MKRGTFKYLEQILIDYPEYELWIRRREQDIITPWREQDGNIGGSRSNAISNDVERLVSSLLDDKNLARLKEERDAIAKTLDISHPTTRTVINTYYFKRPRTLNWEGVALKCSVSCSHAKKIRTKFFKDLACELGLSI